LNTTLIFVSPTSRFNGHLPTIGKQAGLFSAVASAFIIQVAPELRPDSGDETTALLRVLIYKIDNTAFGSDVPSLPQWTGPPRAVVHVQAILLASLAASLFSAFLAMLGKQWLNRYDATDKRGSAVERAQNRQQKLDGIVAWYFDHVLESLPLMLQAALLLLGCALSRYLWEVNTTSLRSLSSLSPRLVLSSIFSLSLRERLLRVARIKPLVPSSSATSSTTTSDPRFVQFALSNSPNFLVQNSWCYRVPIGWWSGRAHPWYSMRTISSTPSGIPSCYCSLHPPCAYLRDAYLLGRAILRVLVAFYRSGYRWFVNASPQQIPLDLRCISWTLQTSLDQPVRLFTLEHLAKIPEVANSDPSLVVIASKPSSVVSMSSMTRW
jgi:hypothetical protein